MSDEKQASASPGLLEYASEQKIWQVGNTKIGGQPGAQPTVLIGTAFYHKHDVVIDADRGEIDEAEAEKRIRLQEDYSQRTGNPCMLDVVGATPDALVKNLEFAAKITDMPLLIDGTTAAVRIAAPPAGAAAVRRRKPRAHNGHASCGVSKQNPSHVRHA